MKYLLSIIFTGVLATMVYAEQPTYDYVSGIKMRQQKLLEFYSSLDAKHLPFPQIAAKLRLGLDIDKCREDFEWNLDNPVNDMFFGLPMITCYLWGYPYWTEEIHAKAKKVWRTYFQSRGDTENHWVLWHTGVLLAAQTWPDMTFFNGRNGKENYNDSVEFLDFWFDTFSTIGSGEFDSPCYFAVYMNAMFSLYEFAQDPVLKQKAEMAIDWWMADYAIDYLDGAYTGGHARVYDRDILLPGREGGDMYGYIYFGNSLFPVKSEALVLGALCSYIPPQLIQDIALDRSTPYSVEKRKRVRNIIRFESEMNPPVYKENYMSKSFGMGCNDGGIQQPLQIHTWGITYTYEDAGGKKNDEIFALHPYCSDKEAGMFFPEKLKILVNDIARSKNSYNKEDKLNGGSEYERMFQYKNAIIGLYNLDPNTTFKHIDYYFPASIAKREIDPSGWIFCQAGKAYIAIKPFKAGKWTEKIKVQPYKEGAWSDTATYDRLISPDLKNGYVAMAYEASDYKSWDDFKAAMIATKVDTSKLDSDVEVSYTTPAGDVMKFQFPDKRSLNGNPVDYKNMPLFKSPFVNGNDKVMKITYGKQELTIDFSKTEIVKKITK